jgi:hypothetical protein
MSGETDALARFPSEDCGECGTPGPQRHLSAVGGCETCAAADPRPVNVPVRGVLPYDLPLPSPGPGRGTEWWAWRSAGGNLVAEAGRKVPWPPIAPKCYRLASGAMVHVKPDCRC